ncbi:nucleoside deaminase [Halalkalibacter hemicellulosilyticus]|uniref:Guanine deaminase n=1 Tax=Halalkalibacter hemicellulosilyticusJCM 9152 TaxID=1236971 RepID=W4QD18_9BACI|nr:nucleoside deaminase [Halalkalibacter hemicellulosilyticus]GAE29852.1 guanine deaminase [Halalkalibacter hemicellulosilyticusJCM 9152]
MNVNEIMNVTMQLAYENSRDQKGGPFAAVIVKDGKIIAEGTNEVTSKKDPTAHAEIQAIRSACERLNDFQLRNCHIITSCEPCPMCLGAIYWARLESVYYYYTREDAAKIGFDDQFIYDQISLSLNNRTIKMKKVDGLIHYQPFELWKETENRIEY